MPTNTYTSLANLTLGSAAASVTFSSISQAYRDLILVYNGQTTGPLGVRVNGDSGTNYPIVIVENASSYTYSNQAGMLTSNSSWTSNNENMLKLEFFDYSATDKHKTILSRNSIANTGLVLMNAARWTNTSAITTVNVYAWSGSMNAGSSLSLYGIAS